MRRWRPSCRSCSATGVGGSAGGRRVVTTTGGRGGYAGDVAVDAALPFEVPGELSLADAVALLADGRTALSQIDMVAIRPGETALVLAAAGGVGSLLVQLAAGAGARVVAIAGGQAKAELALSLGADTAVGRSRRARRPARRCCAPEPALALTRSSLRGCF